MSAKATGRRRPGSAPRQARRREGRQGRREGGRDGGSTSSSRRPSAGARAPTAPSIADRPYAGVRLRARPPSDQRWTPVRAGALRGRRRERSHGRGNHGPRRSGPSADTRGDALAATMLVSKDVEGRPWSVSSVTDSSRRLSGRAVPGGGVAGPDGGWGCSRLSSWPRWPAGCSTAIRRSGSSPIARAARPTPRRTSRSPRRPPRVRARRGSVTSATVRDAGWTRRRRGDGRAVRRRSRSTCCCCSATTSTRRGIRPSCPTTRVRALCRVLEDGTEPAGHPRATTMSPGHGDAQMRRPRHARPMVGRCSVGEVLDRRARFERPVDEPGPAVVARADARSQHRDVEDRGAPPPALLRRIPGLRPRRPRDLRPAVRALRRPAGAVRATTTTTSAASRSTVSTYVVTGAAAGTRRTGEDGLHRRVVLVAPATWTSASSPTAWSAGAVNQDDGSPTKPRSRCRPPSDEPSPAASGRTSDLAWAQRLWRWWVGRRFDWRSRRRQEDGPMNAGIGDRIVIRGHQIGELDRHGVVVEVRGSDGTPPRVRAVVGRPRSAPVPRFGQRRSSTHGGTSVERPDRTGPRLGASGSSWRRSSRVDLEDCGRDEPPR